jgi:hypothetical protein
LKSLTVADLRRHLDLLDPPADADIFLRPSMDDDFMMPLHGVFVVHGGGNPKTVCLTGDVEALNDLDD